MRHAKRVSGQLSSYPGGGLEPSCAVIPALRQVSKVRLQERIGELPESVMEQLGEAIAVYLSD